MFLRTNKISKKVKSFNRALSPFYRSRIYFNLPLIDKCTVVSECHEFFYCRIPKAANSTVMATLVFADSWFRAISREDIKYAKEKVFSRASKSKVVRKKVIDEYFKFTVVRHPYARSVSAFNDKIIDASGYQEVVRNRIKYGVKDTREVNKIFDDFLTSLERTNVMSLNYHFSCQTCLMAIKPEKLDYIGRGETLSEDLAYITKTVFGSSGEIVTWAPHGQENAIKPRDKKMHIDMLTKNQKNRLYRLYRRDFEALNYEP